MYKKQVWEKSSEIEIVQGKEICTGTGRAAPEHYNKIQIMSKIECNVMNKEWKLGVAYLYWLKWRDIYFGFIKKKVISTWLNFVSFFTLNIGTKYPFSLKVPNG